MSEQQTIEQLSNLLDHLDSLLKQLNHADQVFFKVNESLKRSLRTYFSLLEKDNLKQEEKVRSRVDLEHEQSNNRKTNKVSRTRTESEVRQFERRSEKSKSEAKLDKILGLARSIRSRDAPAKENDEKLLPDKNYCFQEEKHKPIQQISRIEEITPYVERIQETMTKMKSAKKKRENSISRYLHNAENLHNSLVIRTCVSTQNAAANFGKVFRSMMLYALHDYMNSLADLLDEVVSDSSWCNNAESCSTFYELYSSFDRNVTTNLMEVDLNKKARDYERQLLSLVNTEDDQLGDNDRVCAYLGEWGIDQINQDVGLSDGKYGTKVHYNKERELTQFHASQSEVQTLLLQEHIEDMISQILALFQNGQFSDNDKKRIYRVLCSCLLNGGRSFCSFLPHSPVDDA